MLRTWHFAISALISLLSAVASAADKPADSKAETVAASTAQLDAKDLEFFESKVRRLRVKQCYECHSAESN